MAHNLIQRWLLKLLHIDNEEITVSCVCGSNRFTIEGAVNIPAAGVASSDSRNGISWLGRLIAVRISARPYCYTRKAIGHWTYG
jgi:hypothetical protein